MIACRGALVTTAQCGERIAIVPDDCVVFTWSEMDKLRAAAKGGKVPDDQMRAICATKRVMGRIEVVK